MDAWTGIDRSLSLRACIAGTWDESNEGFEVQGRVSSSDSWSQIELIRGYPYSNSYDVGDTLPVAGGDDYVCVQKDGLV